MYSRGNDVGKLVDLASIDVDQLVNEMLEIKQPQPEKLKAVKNKYYKIVDNWLNAVPTWFAQLHMKSNVFDKEKGYLIPMVELRKVFPYRHTCPETDKKHYWYETFQKGLCPLFRITKHGYKFDNDSSASLGWPMFQMKMSSHKLATATEPAYYDECSLARINLSSLESYVLDTRQRLNNKNNSKVYREKLQRNETAAIGLLAYVETNALPTKNDNVRGLIQYYTKHNMGRYYAAQGSYSMQTLPREPRNAALAGTVNIDIDTAVFAYYAKLAKQFDIDIPISLATMLENKTLWRKTVATDSIVDTRVETDIKINIVKSAITALGFGARNGPQGSISKAIWNNRDRERFTTHPWVQQLVATKKAIVSCFKKDSVLMNSIKQNPEFLYANDSINWNKWLAAQYQTEESSVMETVRAVLASEGIDVYLLLHDGLYVDKSYLPSGRGVQPLVERAVHAQHGDTYRFEAKLVKPYHNSSAKAHQTAEDERFEHRKRILNEEAAAQTYVPVFATTNKTDPVKQKSQAENNTKTLELHLARYQTFDDDYKDEHSFNDYLFEKTGLRISY